MEKHLLAIDIGTQNITAVIGGIDETNEIQLLGIASSVSKGYQNGVVVHLDNLVKSIRDAVDRAEEYAGITESDAVIGFASPEIKSFNCQGAYNRIRPNQEISEADIQSVLESAKSSLHFIDRDIIHLFPQKFSIDEQHDIFEKPVGMIGKKISVDAHIVTCPSSLLQNIQRAVINAGYNPVDFALNQVAASYSVLDSDEKKLGVLLIDIGDSTTDIALFINGHLWHSSVRIPAGHHISRDLAVNFRVPFSEAENLKKNVCNLLFNEADDSSITVNALGSKPKKTLMLSEINKVSSFRIKEIVDIIANDIINTGLNDVLPAGIILCGGTAKFNGLCDYISSILKMPVNIGIPKNIKGQKEIISNPQNAAALGLLIYAQNNLKTEKKHSAFEPLQSAFFKNEMTGKLKQAVVNLKDKFF